MSTKRTRRGTRKHHKRGGSMFVNLALPAALLYANNVFGKGKVVHAKRTPYVHRTKKNKTSHSR